MLFDDWGKDVFCELSVSLRGSTAWDNLFLPVFIIYFLFFFIYLFIYFFIYLFFLHRAEILRGRCMSSRPALLQSAHLKLIFFFKPISFCLSVSRIKVWL